jgi:hypothetical protein
MTNAIKIFFLLALLFANYLVWQKAFEPKGEEQTSKYIAPKLPVTKTLNPALDTLGGNIGMNL